jgi:hypothetical protein
MQVNQRSGRGSEDAFDALLGNKDFRPLLKLLRGRSHLLAALRDHPEEQVKWDAAAGVLESFIDLVWFEGCQTFDDRWVATGLAREFVYRFSQVVPPEQ